MYGYIREYECNKLDVPRPMDLSSEVVTLLEKLMLTQAQVSKHMSYRVIHAHISDFTQARGPMCASLCMHATDVMRHRMAGSDNHLYIYDSNTMLLLYYPNTHLSLYLRCINPKP